MKFYVFYRNTNGEVTQFGAVEDDAFTALVPPSGFTKLETTALKDNANWYFPSGVETARPDFLSTNSVTNSGGVWTANGVDTLVIGSSLPNPTTVVHISNNGAQSERIETVVTDGVLNITTLLRGTYQFEVYAFPFKDYFFTIEAE